MAVLSTQQPHWRHMRQLKERELEQGKENLFLLGPPQPQKRDGITMQGGMQQLSAGQV